MRPGENQNNRVVVPPPIEEGSLEDRPIMAPAMTEPLPQAPPATAPKTLLHLNKWAMIATGVLLLIIIVAAVAMLWTVGFKSNQQARQPASEYDDKSLALDSVSPDGLLEVSQAAKLSINGELQVGSAFILTPSNMPSSPKTGQIYYDKTTNTPYVYNGASFVSMLDVPAVQSLGGLTGSIELGNGLQLNGNQLAVTAALQQSIGARVTTIQGQTGDVSLTAGSGIIVNGTTISNSGVVQVVGTNGLSVVQANGTVTLGLPQLLGTTNSPTFASVQLSSALGMAYGGTGLAAGDITPNSLMITAADGSSYELVPGTVGGQCLITDAMDSNKIKFGSCTGGSGGGINGITDGNSVTVDGNVVLRPATGSPLTVAANAGTDTIELNLTLRSGSGMIANASGLGLTNTCSGNQILKWNGTAWACANDNDTITPADGGVTSVGALNGQSKNAAGAAISGTNVYMQTADSTYPGLVSTTGQSFAGAKTFDAQSTFSAGIAVAAGQSITGAGALTVSVATNTNLTLATSGTGALYLSGYNCSASGGGGKLTVDNTGKVICGADGDTDTVGITQITAGNGISISGANNTIAVNLQSGSGLQVSGAGLGLLNTCTSGQILKYVSSAWSCDDDDTGAGDGVGITSVGAIDGGTLSANGAYTNGTALFLQSASSSHPGLVNLTTQTFAGAKTFSSAATFSASGTAVSITNDASIGGTLTAGAITGSSALTISAGGSNHNLVLSKTGTGNIVLNGFNCTTSQNGGALTVDASGNISCSDDNVGSGDGIGTTAVGTLDGQTKHANGAVIYDNAGVLTLVLQSADATFAGLVNTGTQTFAGAKTFNGNVTVGANLIQSGTGTFSTGTGLVNLNGDVAIAAGKDLTLGAVCASGEVLTTDGSGNVDCVTDNVGTGDGVGVTTLGSLDGGTLSANGAYITGSTLYLQSASGSHVGLVNLTAQTFAGAKTFSSAATFSAAGTALTVNNNATISGTLTTSAITSGAALGLTAATNSNLTLATSGTGALYLSGYNCSASGGGGKLTVDNTGKVICGADGDTDTTGITDIEAGDGIGIAGANNTISVNLQANSGLQADSTGLAIQTCTLNQILKYGASGWECSADTDTDTDTGITSLTAANASVVIGGSGNTLTVAAQVRANFGLAVHSGQGLGLVACTTTNEILKWSGSAWACATDSEGTDNVGVTVSGTPTDGRLTKFNSSGQITNSNLAESSTTLTYSGNAVINAATGFTGNLLDVQLNGASRLSVTHAGNLAVTGTLNGATISGGTVSGGTLTATAVNGLDVSGTAISSATTLVISGSSSLTLRSAGTNIQNLAGTETLFSADTGNNRVVIGNATGTGANTTALVLDSAASDPTGVVGAMYYNTTDNVFRCYTTGWFNCSGTGASVASGAGTSNKIVKFNGSGQLADSKLNDDGTTLAYTGGSFSLQNAGGLSILSADHLTNALTVGQGSTTDTYAKVTDPSSLVGSDANDVAWSPNGVYMSVATINSPYVHVYKRSGDTFTKLSDPASLPAGTAEAVSWSPDGTYMTVAHSSSPFVTIYKRSGDTFTKLSNPSSLPANTGNDVAWSSNGVYMAVVHPTSPFVTIYKRSGDTFTKLSNPSSLPGSTSYSVTFSPDTNYMAVSTGGGTPLVLYKRSGDTFIRLTDPVQPPNTTRGVAFSPDGQYLSAAHATTPFVTTYKRSGDTFTKLSDPASLPPSTSYGVDYSPDGQYMVVTSTSPPRVTIYKRSGDTYTKLTDPAVTPTGIGYDATFSPDGQYLTVAHAASPYITTYRIGSGQAMNVTINGVLNGSNASLANLTVSNGANFQGNLSVQGETSHAGNALFAGLMLQNVAAGFTGNLVELQVGGSQVFRIDQAGNIQQLTSATINGLTLASGSLSMVGGSLSISSTTSSLTLSSGGSSSVTLDSASTGGINIGTNANQKFITIGNTTGGTGVTVQSGSNGITLTGNTSVTGNMSISTGSQYRINGTQITSAALSNDSDLAKISASNTFTGQTNTFNSTATTQNGLVVNANSLTTGSGLKVSTTSTAFTGGNLLEVSQNSTYSSTFTTSSKLLNVSRSITGAPLPGSVVYETAATGSVSNGSSVSWSHTVGSGANRAIVVNVFNYSSTTSTVTYTVGGVPQSLTKVGTVSNIWANTREGTVWILANPTSGTGTVSVTAAGTSLVINGQSTSWTGVHQTTPNGTVASAIHNTNEFGGTTLSPISASGTQLVVDALFFDGPNNGTPGVGSGQTSTGGNQRVWSSYKLGATSMAWTWSGPNLSAQIAVPLNPAPSTGAVDGTVTGPVANISGSCLGCNEATSVLNVQQSNTLATGAVLAIQNAGTGYSIQVDGASSLFSGQQNGYNAAAATLLVGRNSTTLRSINAAGAIGASGADYAEWIPWTGPKPDPGSVVIYKGSTFVVSSLETAAIVGNDKIDTDNAILVAFSGQLPVKVTGPVNEGDILIPNGDGTAKAVPTAQATMADYANRVAIAWETNLDPGVKKITGAVGTSAAGMVNASALQGAGSFASLNVTGNVEIGGNLTVAGLTTVEDIVISGHVITAGGQPTNELQAASGGGAVVTIDGNDTLGTITVTTGSAPTAGAMAKVTFSEAYGKAPRVVLSASNENAAGMRFYKGITTVDGFMLNFKDAPTANTTYTFDYFIGE